MNSCQDAIPHGNGLDILNDCEENQKLVQKLPDWAITCWNRQVTEALNFEEGVPSFKKFVAFVAFEADIACF